MTLNDDEQLNIGEAEVTESVEQSPIDVAAPVQISDEQNSAKTVKNARVNKIVNIVLWVLIAVLTVMLVLRLFVFTNITVSGESMLPTYNDGDVVTVNKLAKPKRGDVVVFYKHNIDSKFKAMFAGSAANGKDGPYEKLIKRVVAIEGDKIWTEEIAYNEYRLVILTASGETLYENYYTRGKTPLGEFTIKNDTNLINTGLGKLKGYTEDEPLVISQGNFYVMGDNRGNSNDSRSFGQVPMDRLFGVVLN